MGGGFPLIKSYRMSLLSAGSISLDSTFKGATSKSNCQNVITIIFATA